MVLCLDTSRGELDGCSREGVHEDQHCYGGEEHPEEVEDPLVDEARADGPEADEGREDHGPEGTEEEEDAADEDEDEQLEDGLLAVPRVHLLGVLDHVEPLPDDPDPSDTERNPDDVHARRIHNFLICPIVIVTSFH